MREPKKITFKDGEGGRELTVVITPMNAVAAERWMLKAGIALGRTLTSISNDSPVERLAEALGSLDYDKVAPLWDELLTCCEEETADGTRVAFTPGTVAGKIESPLTLIRMKVEALKVNFGFFTNGKLSTFLESTRGSST